MDSDVREDWVPLPRTAIFPVELRRSQTFVPDDPATWPRTEGRLELVGGRLLFMPPCGILQQAVAVDVVTALREWAEAHPEFFVGGNEAGMLLGGEVRGADAAVWRRSDLGAPTHGFARVPPLLAVEVSGLEEDEDGLRFKATWYLRNGVPTVWLLLVDSREVVVVTATGERRYKKGDRLPPPDDLTDLAPAVDRLFSQIR